MASGMTKTQLVRHLAAKLEMNHKTAQSFLETLAETAVKETKNKGVFVIPGLGRLVKSNRKARMGRNPASGEPIKIAAKTVVKFKIGKPVKENISGKTAPKKGNYPGALGLLKLRKGNYPGPAIAAKRTSGRLSRGDETF
ncbi:MAG TPA: HU family DNA-binding protein [Candidatus Dormibacteraeota bacterium]|jgi:DNA-binding protein HU-beta|nr:HU family DNA-binding protein [Candidatus Dormibacteraeota bacterium]